jgi:hypothetical protein
MNLFEAWCKETSASPDSWSEQNPALGQCAISALVVQDLLGGELLRTIVNGESHYWNRLPNGQEVDTTRQQFGSEPRIDSPTTVRERSYVLSFPYTVKRYEVLKSRIASAI